MFSEIKIFFFTYGPWMIILPTYLTFRSREKHSLEIKIISYYMVLSVLALITSFLCWKKSINNLPINHFFTLFEFLILVWFYSKLLVGFISKKIFIVLTLFFTIFALIDSIFLESIFSFNTLGRSVEALIFIFLSFCWFIKLLNSEDVVNSSESKGISYIVGGFFIYFSGSIILFSFSNYINEMTDSYSMNIWTIHTFLSVIMYLTISLGLIKCQTK
jgi:hypothetical protein